MKSFLFPSQKMRVRFGSPLSRTSRFHWSKELAVALVRTTASSNKHNTALGYAVS